MAFFHASDRTPKLRELLATTALSGWLALSSAIAAAQSLPSGGVVVGGSATITQSSATRLDINQTSDRAVINWNSFSIGAGHQVGIQQPGAGSVSVQQVIGTSPSQIFGQLTSNGRVIIANPNGIWFGAGSRVDVAGLVASTATMSAPRIADFMSGGALNFDTPGNAAASIVNDGTITVADGGLAAFVAPGVANSGVIAARLGRVQLASGNRFTLDLNGDGLVNLVVDDKVLERALGPDGQPLSAAVLNSGAISADGGTVLLSANVARGVVDNVIDMTGIVQARAVSVAGGEIILSGGEAGMVAVSGTLDASGAATDQSGGTVKVLGDFIVLNAGTSIDVSGDSGGGTALIGGNFHGAGPEQNASRVYVDGAATINANALTSGSGGNVAVWSDLVTGFNGTITARGGSVSGNGGFVETSGGTLGITSTAVVDTSAPAGAVGRWQLDPHNVTIAAGGTATLADVNQWADTPGSDLTVDPATFDSATNVTIQANNDILINDAISKTAAGGDITMNAGRSIIFEDSSADVTLNSGFFFATINDAQADPANRDAGTAVFTMNGATIATGGGTAAGTRIHIETENGHGATGNITLGILSTAAQSDTTDVGGNVIVTNLVGDILGGATITTSGSPLRSTAGAGRAAGDVTLFAGGAVNAGSITGLGGPARGSGTFAGGTGSKVTVSGTTIEITSIDARGGAGAGSIDAGNAAGGNGGIIQITGSAGVTLGSITTAGGDANGTLNRAGGDGANVTVTGTTISTGTINAEGGNAAAAGGGGPGGNISLTANGATPTLTLTGDLTTVGGASPSGAGGAGGNVTLAGAVSLAAPTTTINAQHGTGTGAAAGLVTFDTGSSVTAATANNALTIQNTGANIAFNGTTYNFGTGGLTLTTTGQLRLDDTVTRFNVPTSGAVTLPAMVLLASPAGSLEFLTGAGGTLNLSTVDFNSGVAGNARTVTFTTDDLSVGGAFSAALHATLVIRPVSEGRNIIVGQAGATAGNLNVTSGALGNLLTSGLASLTIGRSDQASTMSVGYTFPNEILPTARFLTKGDLTVSGAVTGYSTKDTSFVFDAGTGTFDSTAAAITAYGDGDISIGGATLNLGALTSPNDITLSASTSATGNGAISADGLLLRGSGSYTLTDAGNAASTIAADNAGSLAYRDADALIVGTVGGVSGINVGSVQLQTTGNLTLDNAIAASATGTAITLASDGNLINSFGATALSAPSGRWLAWSQNPASDTRGGLAYDFKQYDATYGVTTPAQTTGNGFLYTLAPTYTASLTGSVTKVYDGTTTAPLTSGHFTIVGTPVDGDTVIFAPAGIYDTKDVGVGKTVTADISSALSATNGDATVYGYRFAAPTVLSSAMGTITAAPLTITADSMQRYFGVANPTLTASYSGFVSGETSALVSGLTLGTIATISSPAGSYAITASGATAPNYTISYADGTLTVMALPSADDAIRASLLTDHGLVEMPVGPTAAPNLGAGFGAMPRAGEGLVGQPAGPTTISGFGMGYAAEAANDFANAILDGAGALPPPPRPLRCAENGNGCILNGR